MNIIKYEKDSLKCPFCESMELITDKIHMEIYCSECGLVVYDNTFLKISQIEYFIKFEEKTIKT